MIRATIIQIRLILFYAGLFAVPSLLKQIDSYYHDHAFADRSELIERDGVFLEEVSKELRVEFTHTRPQLDPKTEHINP